MEENTITYSDSGINIDTDQVLMDITGKPYQRPVEKKRRPDITNQAADKLKDAVNTFEDAEDLQVEMLSMIKAYQQNYIEMEDLTFAKAVIIIIDNLVMPKGLHIRLGFEILNKLKAGGVQSFSHEHRVFLIAGIELCPDKAMRPKVKFALGGVLDPLGELLKNI